ncbi:MAG: Pycsar system effector family protein [Maribacter sp.]
MNLPEEPQELEDQFSSKKTSDVGGYAEEMVDHYWGSINYMSNLIRASEIKAGLILSFYGILFNFIIENIKLVILKAPDHPFLYVLLVIWFIATVGSIFFSIRCFVPRLETKYDKNILFFGDVITKYGTIKEFSKTFYKISLNEVELFDQLGQQIYVNSKIAALKFRLVNRSIKLLAFGLIMIFVIAISFFMVSK